MTNVKMKSKAQQQQQQQQSYVNNLFVAIAECAKRERMQFFFCRICTQRTNAQRMNQQIYSESGPGFPHSFLLSDGIR